MAKRMANMVLAASAMNFTGTTGMVRSRMPPLENLTPPPCTPCRPCYPRLIACLAAAPSCAGTFTEVWEETFKQAAPAPTDYSTRVGAFRNGVVAQGTDMADDAEKAYQPEQHDYPAIGKHRQTFGVTWADYGASLTPPSPSHERKDSAELCRSHMPADLRMLTRVLRRRRRR